VKAALHDMSYSLADNGNCAPSATRGPEAEESEAAQAAPAEGTLGHDVAAIVEQSERLRCSICRTCESTRDTFPISSAAT
jgi:hypothetical protein